MTIGPPFYSVHQGMRFAFSNAPSCGSSWPTMMMSGSGNANIGMTRLDVRAQAGLVQAVVERLPKAERTWVMLTYGQSFDARSAANDIVEWVIAQLPAGTYNRHVLIDMICYACGTGVDPVSLRAIANKHKITMWKTCKLEKIVTEAVERIGIRAYDALEKDFENHKWLVD